MDSETAPDWLNADFLISVLGREVKGEQMTINKFDIEPAVPKGDYFGSSLHRVIVDYTFLDGTKSEVKKTRNLIVKSLPAGEMVRMMANQIGSFKREIKVYQEILPAMYKLQQEKFGPNARQFTSNCLYAENDIIVMDDLRQMGYIMANRRKGLDLAHCKATLKCLARFHGLSVALFHENQKNMDGLYEGIFKEEMRPIIEAMFLPGIMCLASVVEKWAGYERFGEKIKKLAQSSVDKIIQVVKPLPNSLSVLNHGDFWLNNILFRYSEETKNVPEEPMFVDFQIARFSSPCLDLQLFMCTTATEDVRYNHMDELLEFYHQELRETLTVVGCDHVQFSLQQLQKEFDDKGIFGLMTGCMLLQLVLSDPKDALDMDHVKEEDMMAVEGNVLEKGFQGTLFRDQFQKLLLHFENKGVI